MLNTDYILDINKNTKKIMNASLSGRKQAAASLWVCIENLLNPPQDFLFPSKMLTRKKMEEIFRLHCELHV